MWSRPWWLPGTSWAASATCKWTTNGPFVARTAPPRGFGRLIRVCLDLRAAVHFSPEAEPWRKGIVERFNDVYDQLCFRPQQCRDLAHVREELHGFETFHNPQQRSAKLGSRTPWHVHT